MRDCAAEVTAAQRQAHTILEAAYQDWTGASATAMRHPLTDLDRLTVQVSRALTQAANQLDDYARQLDKAHQQHRWSLGNILKVAAVVLVTTAAVVVTVGVAAPAAAAIDGALVGAEVAATTVAVGAASSAAVEAAEALTLAVRALHTLRAGATFLKPQILVTAGLSDYEAFRQVQATGTLNVGTLAQHGGTNLVYGIAGAGLARGLATLGADAANPVVQWLAPKLGVATGWGATTAGQEYLLTGQVDPWRVATSSGFAFGGSVVGDLVPRMTGAAPKAATSVAPVATRRIQRVVHLQPHADDPRWGLTLKHVNKHLFGVGPKSLRVIDPGGAPALWMSYVADLTCRPVTTRPAAGIEDVMGVFPRADRTGFFTFGIRIAPTGDGTFDLVTLLTKQ